jgi:hypothetical protein
MNPLPTIVRGVLFLPRDMTELVGNSDRVPRPTLLDVAGRTVIQLSAGANDVSRLSPGVYFVRGQTTTGSHPPGSRSKGLTRVLLAR